MSSQNMAKIKKLFREYLEVVSSRTRLNVGCHVSYGFFDGSEVTDVNYRYSSGDTLLHLSEILTPEIITLLVESGADVNATNPRGKTPLHNAASEWYIKFFSNPFLNEAGRYPGTGDIIASLIENGADVNAVDCEGKTALHHAIVEYRDDTIAALLFNNADPSIRDSSGNTPLTCFFSRYSYTQRPDLLFYYECNFNQFINGNMSLLTLALARRWPQLHIDHMITCGADFSNIFYDTHLLLSCISYPYEFRWLWNNFKYEQSWSDNNSILDILLEGGNYEKFDTVIESAKIGDVIEVMYDDRKRKFPGIHFEENFLIHILTAVYDGYSEYNAEQAIFILLSHGYMPNNMEVKCIFDMFGHGELFELLLHCDIRNSCQFSHLSHLKAEMCLYPDKSIKKIVFEICPILSLPLDWRIKHLLARQDYVSLKASLKEALSYFYDSRLIEKLVELCTTEEESLLRRLRQRSVASLLELSRNEARLFICKRYKTQNSRQFYTALKWMDILPCIKDILSLKLPVYNYNY